MYSTQSQAVEGGSAGWEPSRGLPGTGPLSDSVDDGDGEWSGIGVKCWELNKNGGKGKGQHGPGMPLSSLAFISRSFLVPQDSPLRWELTWP